MEMERAKQIEADKKTAADQIDESFRVASMALDAGKPDVARQVLGDVTNLLSSLMTERDFKQREGKALRTLGGKEKEKYFLGDPYEQLMAYLYLGILDFQAGAFDMARASFRNASLADNASAADGFKSDCYLAFLLEGIASRQLGDMNAADDAFRFAQTAFAFRQHMPLVQGAMYHALETYNVKDIKDKKAIKRLDAVFPLVSESLAVTLSVNCDLIPAVGQAFAAARAALDNPDKDSSAEDLLKACDAKDEKQQATELLAEFEAKTTQCITEESLSHAQKAEEQFGQLVARCRDTNTNVFVLQQVGRAPVKIRSGRYGEMVEFYGYPTTSQRVVITPRRTDTENSPVLLFSTMMGESLEYQARTRGGREMDHILEGRANFRDAMNVTSGIAAGAASAALYAGVASATAIVETTTVTYTVSSSGAVYATSATATAPAGIAAATPALIAVGALLIVSKLSKMIADATHPEGDVRGWNELPNAIFFACASLEPGTYEVRAKHFDRLGRSLPEKEEMTPFRVESSQPTMVLCGSPWQ
jgi:tetratricopeptide (TPR) repeat protein